MQTRTGIEIHVALTPGQRTVGKLLTALHLEALGKLVAGTLEAVILVDGVERVEPLYEAHFVEATPGPHTVEMWMRGKGPSSDALQKAFRGQSLEVVVEAGEVAVLLYSPRDGVGATLELVEQR